ncbi:MAG TPA: BrnT family toxin [Vicinamibacterales bacterium]
MIEFDPRKDARNRVVHHIGLERYGDMDTSTAVVAPDTRRDYGEPRFQVTGFIDGVLHVAVITPRPELTRVISLRRTNARERKRYEETLRSAG